MQVNCELLKSDTADVQSYYSSRVQGPTTPDYAIVATFRHRPRYIGLMIELKWLQVLNTALLFHDHALQPTPVYITRDGRNTELSHEALQYVWSEALFQTMWYVYTGYILSQTVHALPGSTNFSSESLGFPAFPATLLVKAQWQ